MTSLKILKVVILLLLLVTIFSLCFFFPSELRKGFIWFKCKMMMIMMMMMFSNLIPSNESNQIQSQRNYLRYIFNFTESLAPVTEGERSEHFFLILVYTPTSGLSGLAMISFSAPYKKCCQIFPFSTGGRIKTRRLLRIVGKFRTSWTSTTTTSTGRSRSPVMGLSTCTPPTMTSGRFRLRT